jgi:hypothetical protein
VLLGRAGRVEVGDLRDDGDPVPFGDRLAEAAGSVHVAQFWRKDQGPAVQAQTRVPPMPPLP